MIVPGELALGLLLAASAFFLALSLTSYRRSGVRALLWMTIALTAHVVATFVLIIATLVSDSLDDAQRIYLAVADGVALVLILVVGAVEGRGRG